MCSITCAINNYVKLLGRKMVERLGIVEVRKLESYSGLRENCLAIFKFTNVRARHLITELPEQETDVTVEATDIQHARLRPRRKTGHHVRDHHANVRLIQRPVFIEHPVVTTKLIEHRGNCLIHYGLNRLVHAFPPRPFSAAAITPLTRSASIE